MRNILVCLVLICFSCTIALCQPYITSISTGLTKENFDFLQVYKVKATTPIIIGRKPSGTRLPMSLDNYLPSVLDQGSQGSCTAFAVAEALSIRENYVNKKLRSNSNLSTQVLYSPTYLWVLQNQNRLLSEKCDSKGISYSDAFSCIFYNQIVDWRTYPYPMDNPDLCHSKCPATVLTKKIQDRKFGFQEPNIDVTAFKNLLKDGYPICIATNLDMGFYDALYDKTKKGVWIKRPPDRKEQHAMVIVDYDDTNRLFKVLDSHGVDKGDNGFIWIGYDLVNRDLDKGVVYGAYIVSFEKDVKNGPSGNIKITSASANAAFDITGKLVEDTFIGKVTFKTGEIAPAITVRVKGTTTGALTDTNGEFSLRVPRNADLILSYIGYRNDQITLPDRPATVYSDNTFTTWTKNGYFRIFNGLRIGIIDLNKSERTTLVSISDDKTGMLVTNNIELEIGQTVEFFVGDKKFQITLKEIKHAGSLFNITNWNAAFLEYKLLSTGRLTQYF